MHYWYISSSWHQKSVGSSYKDSPNYVKWTRCTYPKWTESDVKYPKWDVALVALDRVNIPCLMHDTCLCQLELWDWMLKLSMYTSNRKMKKPISFQSQRSRSLDLYKEFWHLDPCGQDITITVQFRLLKLNMYTLYGKRKKSIYFQVQRSIFKVIGPLLRILALRSLWARYSKNNAV